MTVREQLNSIAKERILILDGAMGSIIQSLHLDEKSFRGSLFAEHPTPLSGYNDILCLTRPGAIGAIHDTYLSAGADIIETCSFNSTSISLSDYGLGSLAYEVSAEAAKVARKSADKFSAEGKRRFVAGSMGPTAKGASLYPDINNPSKRSIIWDELEMAYYDNARGLLDGGADILLVETVFDTLNAKAALRAISRLLEERQIDVPIMISAAISNENGMLLSGQNLSAFYASVQYVNPWSIGLNCSFNAPKLLPHVKQLSEIAQCLVSAYPNAGMPNKFGIYEEMPDAMSANIEPFFKEGLVNIAGGCCGSTPAHIAEIAAKAVNYKPRPLPGKSGFKGQKSTCNYFSGLQPFTAENNIVRIVNNDGSDITKEFQESLAKGDYEDAADIARDILESDSAILSIKTEDEKAMGAFLDYALMNPYIAKTPFFINSSNEAVLVAALKRLQGRCLAGPINLKDGEIDFLRKIRVIGSFGASAAVTPVDEKGQAETDEQKIEIARRIYSLLQREKYPAQNCVFYQFITTEGDSLHSFVRDNCPDVFIAL
ncbi:MAG: homocysteine S-methyltransferase family protein [Treponema sp.]|jgi:5-methyltetrahydrofolate--homocysteine methyltransferase|nr:homocysteine S-methyltransferase family protein [Treponema sp.]